VDIDRPGRYWIILRYSCGGGAVAVQAERMMPVRQSI
jgi:hypothetical protein